MKAKRTNPAGVIALLLVGAAGVYGVGVYIRRTPDAEHVPVSQRAQPPVEHQPSKQQEPTQPSDSATVKVFTPESHNGQLSFSQASESVPSGVDPKVFALNRFLEVSHIVRAGAKVVGVDVTDDGVAHVSCTEPMDHTVGSSDEEALLNGLCKTLAQFDGVKKVSFEVSGQPIDTFGNVSLNPPIDVKSPAGDSTSIGA